MLIVDYKNPLLRSLFLVLEGGYQFDRILGCPHGSSRHRSRTLREKMIENGYVMIASKTALVLYLVVLTHVSRVTEDVKIQGCGGVRGIYQKLSRLSRCRRLIEISRRF